MILRKVKVWKESVSNIGEREIEKEKEKKRKGKAGSKEEEIAM